MSALFDGTLAMGVVFGAASMASIGPNNVMLVREGLTHGRTLTVATVVWSSYVLLLVSATICSNVPLWIGPSARLWLSWCGLASLSWFAIGAFRAAFSARALGHDRPVEDRRTCLTRVLATVWCNPLTYLELLLVPAAYCATLVGPHQRSEFIGAVMIMHAVTCYGYALGGSLVGQWVGSRRVIRVFDAVSGLLLAGSALTLALAMTVRG